MISTGIMLIAVITQCAAVPGFNRKEYSEYSLKDMLSHLMAATYQDTPMESRMCSGHCFVIIDDEERLLTVGEDFINPKDPCQQIICHADGLNTTKVQCPEIDTCSDGNPPYILPEQCCYTCGGGGLGPPDTFTQWGEWTECSKTCGGGARARRRACALTEEGVLVNCRGKTLEVGSCSQDVCPVPCLWIYSDYSKCSVTCGQGVNQRFPIITQNASHGGEDCPPYVKQGEPDERACKEPDCPVCAEGKTLCLILGEPYYNQCIEDDDHDCVPNRLDNCRNMNNTKQQDMDRDGVGDICDNCVVYRNPDQMNSDNDQTGDECDDDDDNDGIRDVADNCQYIANEHQRDIDGDGYGDKCDNCDSISNKNQNDYDEDGIGNACDNCRYVANPRQESDARQKYGEDKCTNKPSLLMNENMVTEGDKALAAEIMERLLQMYYSD